MMIKKYILIIVIGTCILPNAYNQISTDSMNKIFNDFKNEIQTEFSQFKSHNDSVFIGFLRNSWKKFELHLTERIVEPKPIIQPKIEDSDQKLIKLTPIKKITIQGDNINKKLINKSKIEIKDVSHIFQREKKYECEFYGTTVNFSLPIDGLPELEDISNNGIADFYLNATNSTPLNALLQQAMLYKEQLRLNGLAYVKLCTLFSEKIYTNNNLQILATWYLLANSGQKVKVAYGDESIYLLCSFDSRLYNLSYCLIRGVSYHIYTKDGHIPDFKDLYTYQENHKQQTDELTVFINETPKFKFNSLVKKIKFNDHLIEILINNNLLNFFSDYPDCPLEVTLNASLSDEAFNSLDLFLSKKLNEFNDQAKLDYLLYFVQKAFPYKTDKEQFGNENYLFADECLKYQYSDCEDRVALMAQLVKRYTNFKCVGLDYPGHISFAVNLSKEIQGTYLNINNEKYYICDPTYIGAKCGMIMPQFSTIEPDVIHLF